MERRSSGGSASVVVAVVVAVVVLASGVNAQVYSCLGGCYNQCFLRSRKANSERVACYYQCVNKCVPRSPADFHYYCQIGCSLELCIPASGDGARLERCFEGCSNLCQI